MKTLSIRQPYASLICRGIKTIENRTWETTYRGKILIHASGKPLAWPSFDYLPRDFIKGYQKYYGTSSKNMPREYSLYIEWIEELHHFYRLDNKSFNQPNDINNLAKKYGYALLFQAIVGEAELIDIISSSNDAFAEPGAYHWVMDNPILYKNPILNIMGKLKFWEYENPEFMRMMY